MKISITKLTKAKKAWNYFVNPMVQEGVNGLITDDAETSNYKNRTDGNHTDAFSEP